MGGGGGGGWGEGIGVNPHSHGQGKNTVVSVFLNSIILKLKSVLEIKIFDARATTRVMRRYQAPNKFAAVLSGAVQ